MRKTSARPLYRVVSSLAETVIAQMHQSASRGHDTVSKDGRWAEFDSFMIHAAEAGVKPMDVNDAPSTISS